jgi:hypothetical protein
MVLNLQGRSDAVDNTVAMKQGRGVGLTDIEIRFTFANPLHAKLVGLLVALRARRPHARALLGVEHPKLQARKVRRPTHFAAQRINLPDQMTLRQPTDGRIAGHLPDGIAVNGQQEGLASHAGRSQSGLNARMTGPDDDHIISLGMNKHGAAKRSKAAPLCPNPRLDAQAKMRNAQETASRNSHAAPSPRLNFFAPIPAHIPKIEAPTFGPKCVDF